MLVKKDISDDEVIKDGVFYGLLKDVDIPCDEKDYQGYVSYIHGGVKTAGRDASRQGVFAFKRMQFHGFPSCCGTCIITGFPFSFNPVIPGIGFEPSTKKANEETNKPAFIVYLAKFIKEHCIEINRKSYVICTLNRDQMRAGCSDILVDYLNFSRLEDDWKNKSGSTNVGVFGVCLSEFSSKNL